MRILFLSTWFPYPPTQGSTLRAYHLLKGLAQDHQVALVSFTDRPLQPEWLEHMRQLCVSVDLLPRQPFDTSRVNPLLGWLSPQPAAVRRMYAPEMAALVQQVAREWQPQAVLALTFATAPYALPAVLPAGTYGPGLLRIVDIDNLMCRMLRETYLASTTPLSRLRRWLAAEKFARYERWLYGQFDLSLAVTAADARAAQAQLGLPAECLEVTPNGVDTTFNTLGWVEPEPASLVYNGAMTYQANYDAMAYFLSEIYPKILDRQPQALLRITGSTHGVALERLPLGERVRLTGFVDDVRPVVAGSWGCVVPLRVGGGTRLKVLEAMALGTPVVSTSKGIEGLDINPEQDVLVGDTPEAFSEQTLRLLDSPELRSSLAGHARRLVQEKYEWRAIGQHLAEVIAARGQVALRRPAGVGQSALQ